MNNYVVIDLEMCNTYKSTMNSKMHYSHELIQIGAVSLNENYEVNDFIWWEIDKYCLVEEKYNRLYSVLLDTEGKVLELNYSYDDIDKFSSHQKDVLEW